MFGQAPEWGEKELKTKMRYRRLVDDAVIDAVYESIEGQDHTVPNGVIPCIINNVHKEVDEDLTLPSGPSAADMSELGPEAMSHIKKLAEEQVVTMVHKMTKKCTKPQLEKTKMNNNNNDSRKFIGDEIRDKNIYDRKHDPHEDSKHVRTLEAEAETFLEGIRRTDQDFHARKKSGRVFV